MVRFEPCLLPTGIGSLPHIDTGTAIEIIQRTTPDIPFYPQLPKMDFRESMYVQFSYDLPGSVVDINKGKMYIDTSSSSSTDAETMLKNYLDNRVDTFAIDRDHAAGLYALIESKSRFKPLAVKGEITGPISLGLSIADENGKPVLYNENYVELMTKCLSMRAKWLEKTLREISQTTIISVDEPCLGQLGSAYISIDREKAGAMLKEVISSMTGIRGVHCCSNTDWGLLLKLGIDVVFFDAYRDSKTLLLYSSEIKDFIEGGGIISWGIVPNDSESMKRETVSTLSDKMELNLQYLTMKGVDLQKLLRQSLITTSCGLGSIENVKEAEEIMAILRSFSMTLRKRYGFDKGREGVGTAGNTSKLF